MKRNAGALVVRLREDRIEHGSLDREMKSELYDPILTTRRHSISLLGRGRSRLRSVVLWLVG